MQKPVLTRDLETLREIAPAWDDDQPRLDWMVYQAALDMEKRTRVVRVVWILHHPKFAVLPWGGQDLQVAGIGAQFDRRDQDWKLARVILADVAKHAALRPEFAQAHCAALRDAIMAAWMGGAGKRVCSWEEHRDWSQATVVSGTKRMRRAGKRCVHRVQVPFYAPKRPTRLQRLWRWIRAAIASAAGMFAPAAPPPPEQRRAGDARTPAAPRDAQFDAKAEQAIEISRNLRSGEARPGAVDPETGRSLDLKHQRSKYTMTEQGQTDHWTPPTDPEYQRTGRTPDGNFDSAMLDAIDPEGDLNIEPDERRDG